MNNTKIAMSFREFSLLSETQLKVLALSGYDVEITSVKTDAISHKVATNKIVSNNKATNKVSKPVKTNKTTETKGKKDTRKTGNSALFGKNIKAGCFVKAFKPNHKELLDSGKVAEVILDKEQGDFAKLTDGRAFAIKNCIVCTEKELQGAKGRKARKEKGKKTNASTSTKLSRMDYLICYAYNLLKLGLITQNDFDLAKGDRKTLSDLYQLFAKGEEPVKLSNDNAMKIFAENSSAKANA